MDPFDIFIWIFRGVAVLIIATWAIALLASRDKPREWVPAGFERWPLFQMNRERYRIAAILGIVAGLGVLAFSLVLPSIG